MKLGQQIGRVTDPVAPVREPEAVGQDGECHGPGLTSVGQGGVEIAWEAGKRTVARVDGKPALPIATPPEFRGTDPHMWSPEDALVAAASVRPRARLLPPGFSHRTAADPPGSRRGGRTGRHVPARSCRARPGCFCITYAQVGRDDSSNRQHHRRSHCRSASPSSLKRSSAAPTARSCAAPTSHPSRSPGGTAGTSGSSSPEPEPRPATTAAKPGADSLLGNPS